MGWILNLANGCCGLCGDIPCGDSCKNFNVYSYSYYDTNTGNTQLTESGFFGSAAGNITVYISYYSRNVGTNNCSTASYYVWDGAYNGTPSGVTPIYQGTLNLTGDSGYVTITIPTTECAENGFTVYVELYPHTHNNSNGCNGSVTATCP